MVAMIPGILWMWYIYKSDIFEPEPIGKIILIFVGGILMVIPVALIEAGFSELMGISGNIDSLYKAISLSWFIAGIIEEFAKFGVVIFGIYFTKDFNEPIDGIIYSSAAALGFASLENFIYINKFGTAIILIRGPLSTLGHLLFSALWGYGLGRGKFHPTIARRLAFTGLLLAAGAHGLFNFFLMSKNIFPNVIGITMAIMVIPFVFGLWIVLRHLIRKSESVSPFNPDKIPDELDQYDERNDIG